jgi:hypothetical protein
LRKTLTELRSVVMVLTNRGDTRPVCWSTTTFCTFLLSKLQATVSRTSKSSGRA